MKSVSLFYIVRIFLLLSLLFAVGFQTWLTHIRTTDWNDALWITIYPINADGSERTARYIHELSIREFLPVKDFLFREATKYHKTKDDPVTINLADEVKAIPPQPVENGGPLATLWWSLKMRYWAMHHDSTAGPEPDVRIFVLYHDPEKNDVLRHSLGLEKGLIGVVNAFASRSMRGSNQLVIAHELLHTVGATDKYEAETGLPVYPDGFGEPDRKPRFPQRYTEVMGGRKAVSEHKAIMPRTLKRVVVGSLTAREIGWIDD